MTASRVRATGVGCLVAVVTTSNRGGADILQFELHPSATKVTFNVVLDGVPATNQVMIGLDGKTPDAMPFSLPAHPKP